MFAEVFFRVLISGFEAEGSGFSIYCSWLWVPFISNMFPNLRLEFPSKYPVPWAQSPKP